MLRNVMSLRLYSQIKRNKDINIYNQREWADLKEFIDNYDQPVTLDNNITTERSTDSLMNNITTERSTDSLISEVSSRKYNNKVNLN